MQRFTIKPLIIVISLLLSLFIVCEAIAKRFSSEISKTAQKQILEIEQHVGLDIKRGMITRPYTDQMRDTFLRALESRDSHVRSRALTLLAKAIKQLEIPKGKIDKEIKPAIEHLLENHTARDEINLEVVQGFERILWQIKLKELTKEKTLLKFLEDILTKNNDKSIYFRFEAIDLLVEIGTLEARNILEKKLKEQTKRSIPKKIVERIEVGLEKIDAKQPSDNIDLSFESKKIINLIVKKKDLKNQSEKEFIIWAMRRLAEINDPTAIKALKKIWRDHSFEDDYRYEAQENLIQLKIIKEEERTIFHDF